MDIQLHKGNCFDVLERFKDVYFPLIVSDPPYKMARLKGGGFLMKDIQGMCNDLTNAGITESYDIGRFAELVNKLQRGNINAYFFCNKLQIPEYLAEYVGRRKCKFDIICWHKTNVPPTYSNKYLPDTEYILFFHKGKGHTFPRDKEDATTWYLSTTNVADKKRYGHPTPKPLSLVTKLIRNSSKEGDMVLDPFMGSGTTGVACQSLNRNFVGVEVNEEFFNIAKRRIEHVPIEQSLFDL